MNIVEHIFRNADGDAIAVIHDGERVTFRQLSERVDLASQSIAKVKAPRVGLDCPNGIEHVVLALAIVRSGKCLVPIASELTPRERDEVMNRIAVGAVVDRAGNVRERECVGKVDFDEASFASLNPAFVRFSSGTTGRSKGIVLSHERLLERTAAANRGLNIQPADRVVWILPMAHHFAVSIMLYLLRGAATIIVDSHLAEDVLSAALKHGGTVLYGAPFHHRMLAGEPSGRPWPSLRLAVSTAARLSAATAEAFLNRYGVPLSQGLGVIEVGLAMLNLDGARERPESIGKPLPDYEADLRDGELLLRGPGMLDAYLDPWRKREEILEEGWFHTGDICRKDEAGYFYLSGRVHSVINVAGMKCFPEEIEAVLCEHPEIQAALVAGTPHPSAGMVPTAELVARDPACPPSIPSVIAHCRSSLARYKIPVDFRFVEALPLTASGKIKRSVSL